MTRLEILVLIIHRSPFIFVTIKLGVGELLQVGEVEVLRPLCAGPRPLRPLLLARPAAGRGTVRSSLLPRSSLTLRLLLLSLLARLLLLSCNSLLMLLLLLLLLGLLLIPPIPLIPHCLTDNCHKQQHQQNFFEFHDFRFQ